MQLYFSYIGRKSSSRGQASLFSVSTPAMWLTEHPQKSFPLTEPIILLWFHSSSAGHDELNWLINKTAGHNRHDFRVLTLLKIPFRRLKVLSRKTVIVFSKFEIFMISTQNLQSRWKKTFLKNNIIWLAFSANLLLFILKKLNLSEEKNTFFPKTNPNCVHIWGIIRKICYDSVMIRKRL